MINGRGSRGGLQDDDLRPSRIRNILPKKEKHETRLKSFLNASPHPPRKIVDQPLIKQKRTKKKKDKQTIGLLITLPCNQLADVISFYGLVLIVLPFFRCFFAKP